MLDVAGVWDIETANWDRFVVGETLSRSGERFVSWDEDTFWTHLASREGVWYAHAGGSFDALWFLQGAVRRRVPWTARLRGSGVLAVRVGTCEVRDSIALVPMSLAKAAPMGGATKIRLELDGGYEALSHVLTPAERARVEEYLHADCVALLGVLDALERVCSDKGISLRLTVGGSAWATAQDWLSLPKSTHTLGRYRQIREGYYGGRVEVYRQRAPSGHRYDIHSSYPAALTRVALPTGAPVWCDATKARRVLEGGHEGVIFADVWVPPSTAVPPLPVRVKERLLYPVGPVRGAWTTLELRRAIEAGARVERVRWGYGWRTSEPVLKPYAERVWAYRAEAAAEGTPHGKAWAAWFKWLANSLTGKLAQRPEKDTLRFAPADGGVPEVDEGTIIVRATRDGVFYRTTTTRVDACAHVEWSAYLTAEARCELGAQLRHARAPLYCDTDSVYAEHELTRRVGDELGEWGYEGPLRAWEALAPKVYRYQGGDGAIAVRGKGLSGLDAAGFDALARGEPWRVTSGVDGLRTAVRRGDGEQLFRRRTLARGLHPVPGWIGGRELERDGSTRPTTLARYERAMRGELAKLRRVR